MSKGKWRYPRPGEIKRAIKANLDLGLTVTGVRVDEHGITVSTAQPNSDPPPPNEGRPNSFDEVLGRG